METFELKQVGKSIPPGLVGNGRLTVTLCNDRPGESILLIEWGIDWIKIDLVAKTFTFGTYEG